MGGRSACRVVRIWAPITSDWDSVQLGDAPSRAGRAFEAEPRMRRPRHRQPRRRGAFALEWAAAPHARVAVEALEDRFLLAGNARAGLAASDNGGGVLLFN